MTPKEKAEQLVEKFKPLCDGYFGGKINKAFAKQCALIAVEEILSHITITTNQSGLIRDFQKEYWQQVKTEIENL
jgi:hypothetical protein